MSPGDGITSAPDSANRSSAALSACAAASAWRAAYENFTRLSCSAETRILRDDGSVADRAMRSSSAVSSVVVNVELMSTPFGRSADGVSVRPATSVGRAHGTGVNDR